MLAALILVLVAIFMVRVGPPHDDLWNLYPSPSVDLASGNPFKVRIGLPGFSVPLLSGPYHGAIKTNLFELILPFTRDITAIRVANSILFALLVPIFLWSWPAALSVGWQPVTLYAAVGMLLMPTLYINVPLDYGAFVVSSLLLAAGLAAVIRAQRTDDSKYYWIAYAAGCLCVYEKLTQLNFAIPLCMWCVIALLRRQFGWRTLFLAAVIPAITLLPYAIYFLALNGWAELLGMTAAPKAPFTANFAWIIESIVSAYVPDRIFTLNNYFGESLGYRLLGFVFAIAMLMSILVWVRSPRNPTHAFLWSILVGSVLVQSLVSGLNRPWHFFPYSVIAYFIIGHAIYDLGRTRALRTLAVAATCLAAAIAAAPFIATLLFLGSHSAIGIASPAILDVAAALGNNRERVQLVCVDYSVCHPLAFLIGPNATMKADFAFTPKGDDLPALVDAAMDKNATLVLRQIDTPQDPGFVKFLNAGWQLASDAAANRYERFARIDDNKGTRFFLYRRR